MANDGRMTPLGEVAHIVMGLSPKGDTYNHDGHGEPLLNGPTEFGPTHPIPVLFTTSPSRFAEPGDILFCVRGSTTGRMNWADRRYAVGRGIAAIRAKTNNSDTYFIYCSILADLPRLLSLTSGSVFPSLSTGDFAAFEIPWPDSSARDGAVRVLRSLDDKIELNRRMNRTLEKMAAALFKSWFIDFDPTRAKAEGRDPGLPAEIADLFPGTFEDSPLGPIPQGWKVSKLGDLIELAYGKSLRAQDRLPGPVAVYGSNGQVGWHDTALVKGPGIVVGRKGNPGIVTWTPAELFPIDTTFYVVPSGPIRSLYFLFHALRHHDLARLGADSAVPGLNRNMAYMSKQIVPPSDLVTTFDSFVKPLCDRIYLCERQNRRLAGLRDTLLPKLLSGEIELPTAEAIVEEVS